LVYRQPFWSSAALSLVVRPAALGYCFAGVIPFLAEF
jgi:hypothetical protein